jgi:hypothetical protein
MRDIFFFWEVSSLKVSKFVIQMLTLFFFYANNYSVNISAVIDVTLMLHLDHMNYLKF